MAKINDNTKSLVLELYGKHTPWTTIVIETGVSQPEINKILRAANVKLQGQGRRMLASNLDPTRKALDDKIERAWMQTGAQRRTIKQIASDLGTYTARVYRVRLARDLPPRGRGPVRGPSKETKVKLGSIARDIKAGVPYSTIRETRQVSDSTIERARRHAKLPTRKTFTPKEQSNG